MAARAAGLQESLHHRDFAIALRIRPRGHAGDGPDGPYDAGARSDGTADWFGNERVRRENSQDAPGRSARRDTRGSPGPAHAATPFVEGKTIAQNIAGAGSCASAGTRNAADQSRPGSVLRLDRQ